MVVSLWVYTIYCPTPSNKEDPFRISHCLRHFYLHFFFSLSFYVYFSFLATSRFSLFFYVSLHLSLNIFIYPFPHHPFLSFFSIIFFTVIFRFSHFSLCRFLSIFLAFFNTLFIIFLFFLSFLSFFSLPFFLFFFYLSPCISMYFFLLSFCLYFFFLSFFL
ncbi:unnamed protein product [Acanthosepion pharaonis]|uniref:Uncharacterized protein n=1 Tax=Acanthosepion pharaonis TaxID=158019 RepID=A0A812AW43_ACAPH|nr:unnamed protein product [Sepia pharaonis]